MTATVERPPAEVLIRDAIGDILELAPSPGSTPSPAPTAAPPQLRMLVPVAAGLVAIVGIGAVALLGAGDAPSSPVTSIADETIVPGEARRYVLLDLPGWTIVDADEESRDAGWTTFSDGTHELRLQWHPEQQYAQLVRARQTSIFSTTHDDDHPVLGRAATLYRMLEPGARYLALVEPLDGSFVEVEGDAGSEEAFTAALAALRPADRAEWLAGLPEHVVRPGDRASVVTEMLHGVPRPPEFDPTALSTGYDARHRYHLGAAVAGAAACGWFDELFDATERGDDAAAAAAADALATSRGWPVLLRMQQDGGYPEVVWELADAAAGRGPSAGRLTRAGVAESLGC